MATANTAAQIHANLRLGPCPGLSTPESGFNRTFTATPLIKASIHSISLLHPVAEVRSTIENN
jgi:hypothetical protein